MFGENDRGQILASFMAKIDLNSLAKRDENESALIRNELRELFRKGNSIQKICYAFESGYKLDGSLLEEFVRWMNLSKGEVISVATALSFSSISILSSVFRRVLKLKLPEITPTIVANEVPDEIRSALVHLIQNDEELNTPDISGNYVGIIKDVYGINILPSVKHATQNSLVDFNAVGRLTDSSRQKLIIANVIEEYGPQISKSAETFRQILVKIGVRLDEEQVAAILILILPKSYSGFDEKRDQQQWNLEVIAEVLNAECRGLNWVNVVKGFDSPKLAIRSETDFLILVRMFVRISGSPLPASGLLSNMWTNRNALFAMLTLSASSPRNLVDFSPLITQEQLIRAEGINIPPNCSWLCLPLYTRMLELANTGLAMEVLEIIAKAAATYPEYVLVSLAQMPEHAVRNELVQRLLPLFTGLQGSRPTSIAVMRKLFQVNTDILIRLFCVTFRRAKKVSEVLSTESIISSVGAPFLRRIEEEGSAEELLSLWCIKTDKGELNLEEKLTPLVESNPKCARVFANFMRQHGESLRPRGSQQHEGILSFECFAVLYRIVQSFPTIVLPEELKVLLNLYTQQQHITSSMLSQQQQQHNTGLSNAYGRDNIVREIVDATDVARLPPGQESEDIENIANSYFHKIYTTDISIPDIINVMRQFKSSTERREQEIFRCMIHNLFDEYRFFHKYPDKELAITARLFGALIQNQLVSSITLGIALRYVLEALRKDPEMGEGNDKMFRFGHISLEQFRSRLVEWPQYCSHLIQIPHLVRHCPDLFQEAQRSLSNPQQSFPPSTVQPTPVAVNMNNQFGGNLPYVSEQQNTGNANFPGQSQSLLQQQSFGHLSSAGLHSQSMPPQQSLAGNSVGGGISALQQQFVGLNLGNNHQAQQTILPSSNSLSSSAEQAVFSSNNQAFTATATTAFKATNPVAISSTGSVLPSAISSPQQVAESAMLSQLATSVSSVSAKESSVDAAEKETPHVHEIDRMLVVNQPIVDTVNPPDSVRDQIQFVVNNMAKNNIETKAIELKDLLKPEFYGWFATYLVEKRVSSQPNLHSMYLSALDVFQLNDLNRLVLDSTYFNVTKYLSSPIITTSSNERSVLRNFGMWLGQLTLARNKPLLQRRINLKSLIIWGYETGRLIAVCSFIAKVIEGVKESKVFRPPNPWLMAILGLLKELNEIEDLKLNIKFEVQALCKNINVKIEDIPKSDILSKARQPIKDSRNPDFTVKPGTNQQNATPVTTQVTPQQLPMNQMQAVTPQQLPVSAALPLPQAANQNSGPGQSAVQSAGDSLTSPVLNNTLPAAESSELSVSVVINPALQFFATNPNQRRLVSVAVERGIKEIIQSAVERSVAIATATTKQLVLKDFANESDENVVRNAAHLMTSSLAGSLALATCKEPLRISIGNHLRNLLATIISDQNLIEQIVQVCSNDNIEVGSSLIEKTCIEKAAKEIDEALAEAYLVRKKSRDAGQRFVDASHAVTNLKLPSEVVEMMKSSSVGLSQQQLQLYDFFHRSKISQLTGGSSAQSSTTVSVDTSRATAAAQATVLSMAQALEAYHMLIARLDLALKNLQAQAQTQGREVSLSMLPQDHEIIQLLRDMLLVAQSTNPTVRNETALTFSETVFHRMFESLSSPDSLRLEAYTAVLEALREACGGAKAFSPDIMSWLNKLSVHVNSDDMIRKLYTMIIIPLLKVKLIRAQELDYYLTVQMDSGRHIFWLEIAMSIIKLCLVENLGTIYDFTNSLDTITKMRPANHLLKKQLQKYLTDVRALATAQEEQRNSAQPSGVTTATNAPNAAIQQQLVAREQAFKEQVSLVLDRWLRIWNVVNDQLFSQFLQLMHQCGLLKNEETADKFFKVATEVCCEACLRTAVSNSVASSNSSVDSNSSAGSAMCSTLNYTVLDALTRLFLLLVRLADKDMSDISIRVSFLSRILNVVARSCLDDAEAKKKASQPFDQRTYYRLLCNLSQELGIPDPKVESNSQVLMPMLAAYTQVYLALQPSTLPSFAFSWLQLISKRYFMPHLLRNQKTWPYMHRLLSALFLFLQPFLKSVALPDAVKKLFKGTLKVMLVLLHDFPEFLCEFHLSFCELIPSNCVQLRNLVLSAFPRTMRLPDPFTPNLKVDLLNEISHSPRILTDYTTPIAAIRVQLDNYMSQQQPVDLPVKLAQLLQSGSTSSNSNVVVSKNDSAMITSIVMYVGSIAVLQVQNKVPLANSPILEIFRQLIKHLDYEGKHIFFNSISNQLRYPNSHTSLFSNIILTLFFDCDDESVQEQITRVLLERLVVHRPHPWGLLITFIELIRNPKYAFWRKSFTRGDPEIEKVFENIAKSCIGPSAPTVIQQQLTSVNSSS